jgi:hypothetical protein
LEETTGTGVKEHNGPSSNPKQKPSYTGYTRSRITEVEALKGRPTHLLGEYMVGVSVEVS